MTKEIPNTPKDKEILNIQKNGHLTERDVQQ